MKKISVYIIAYNQIEKIADAIKSVLWADEIVVIDSHSTDGTTELAEKLGARVVQVAFRGFGDLRNQAIAACQHEWIFSLDTDERCTWQARDEILAIINSDANHDIYFVPRKNYFMGRWIQYGGWYPDYRQPQLFRRGSLSYAADIVHENYICHSQTAIGYLQNFIWQIPFRNLAEMMDKANRYSSLGLERLEKKHKKPSMWSALTHMIWTFIKVYGLRRGFLDGWAGVVIAMGHSYGAFYRYAKYYEKKQQWQPLSTLVAESEQGLVEE
jgi:glycosyltransferase involved in cell wall biosynthesis